jgi:hypothetical protein
VASPYRKKRDLLDFLKIAHGMTNDRMAKQHQYDCEGGSMPANRQLQEFNRER